MCTAGILILVSRNYWAGFKQFMQNWYDSVCVWCLCRLPILRLFLTRAMSCWTASLEEDCRSTTSSPGDHTSLLTRCWPSSWPSRTRQTPLSPTSARDYIFHTQSRALIEQVRCMIIKKSKYRDAQWMWLSLQILFMYFLALPSLLHPSILFNCFYTYHNNMTCMQPHRNVRRPGIGWHLSKVVLHCSCY